MQSSKSPKEKFTPTRTPDEIWINRRQNVNMCLKRVVMDLRQLADEIEKYDAEQIAKNNKIKELMGWPQGVL